MLKIGDRSGHTKQNGLGKLRRLWAPATTKIHNNTNTIAPLTRGFPHLHRRTIAASVAAFKTCSRLITGPFGPNRVELSAPPPSGGGVKTPPALYRDWYSSGICSGNSKEICSTYSALFYLPKGARKRDIDGRKACPSSNDLEHPR